MDVAFGPWSNDPLAAPFWAAAREERLVLPWDTQAARFCWYPREQSALEWREVRGAARLFSFSVVRGPINPDFEAPYAPALVVLDAAPGLRLVSQIVDCDFASLRCDMPLALCFRALRSRRGEPYMAPVFRPAS